MTAKVARRALVRCYRYFVALHAEFRTLESGFEQKTGVEHMQKNERKKDSEWNDICYNVATMYSSSLTAFRKRSETNTTHQRLTWLEGIFICHYVYHSDSTV